MRLTSLCPEMVFSNFPSNAPHIFINLSAAVITDKRLMNITCYGRERERESDTHTHTVQTTSERLGLERESLTGAGQPLSVGAELDRGDGFRVAGQGELQAVVGLGRRRLEQKPDKNQLGPE